jgi:hypothetical protein
MAVERVDKSKTFCFEDSDCHRNWDDDRWRKLGIAASSASSIIMKITKERIIFAMNNFVVR